MRRIVGAILVVLGALLLGLGLLAKPYLYPRLATVPLDQDSTSISEGKNMSVLYPHVKNGAAAIDALKGVDVKSTRTVIGIPGKVAEQDLQSSTAFPKKTEQVTLHRQLLQVPLRHPAAGLRLVGRRSGQGCADQVQGGGGPLWHRHLCLRAGHPEDADRVA